LGGKGGRKNEKESWDAERARELCKKKNKRGKRSCTQRGEKRAKDYLEGGQETRLSAVGKTSWASQDSNKRKDPRGEGGKKKKKKDFKKKVGSICVPMSGRDGSLKKKKKKYKRKKKGESGGKGVSRELVAHILGGKKGVVCTTGEKGGGGGHA